MKPKDSTDATKATQVVPEEINPSDISVVDIGLQTDLVEDPDIYYFAGGRHVGSQTDATEEYGPLPPFPSCKSAVIVVSTKPKVTSNYRSNIASRCRTAVNTRQFQQQPITQVCLNGLNSYTWCKLIMMLYRILFGYVFIFVRYSSVI